jgi:hypothetical protein
MPSWIAALKTYNSRQPAWCIPRKGTDEYNKVRKIMSGEKTKKPKILKQVDSFKKQDDIYEEPRNIQRNPTAKITTKKVGMMDVPQDVMNLMGNYLGIKDKAKFNQVNKNVKVAYSEKEKNRDFYNQFESITEDYRKKTPFSFMSTLDSLNTLSRNLKKIDDVIGKYYKKYGEAQKKQEKKIIKYIKDKKLNKNVEDYLTKYFVEDDFNYLTQYEYDEYEDYYGNFWSVDGDNIRIYTTAAKEVRSDIKVIPILIKEYFNTITELVDLYVNKVGDKIVELPTNRDELYNMTRNK